MVHECRCQGWNDLAEHRTDSNVSFQATTSSHCTHGTATGPGMSKLLLIVRFHKPSTTHRIIFTSPNSITCDTIESGLHRTTIEPFPLFTKNSLKFPLLFTSITHCACYIAAAAVVGLTAAAAAVTRETVEIGGGRDGAV